MPQSRLDPRRGGARRLIRELSISDFPRLAVGCSGPKEVTTETGAELTPQMAAPYAQHPQLTPTRVLSYVLLPLRSIQDDVPLSDASILDPQVQQDVLEARPEDATVPERPHVSYGLGAKPKSLVSLLIYQD